MSDMKPPGASSEGFETLTEVEGELERSFATHAPKQDTCTPLPMKARAARLR
jgi:hypothetical protein